MKIIAISDTHGKHNELEMEDGDVLIHCGDATNDEYQETGFLRWMADQPHKYKILIAGNHDFRASEIGYEAMKKRCERAGIIYLEDTSVVIDGIKFHGSPWALDLAQGVFIEDESFLEQKWDLIPDDTEVLITHTPSYGILDDVKDWEAVNVDNIGSITLKERVKALKNLVLHLFGHVHGSAGSVEKNGVMFCNASSFSNKGQVVNPIHVFEIK